MRTSPLHDIVSKNGAKFSERFGAEIVSSVADAKTEYSIVRDGVGISDMSHIRRFRFPEEKGLDVLDTLCAGNVARLRFGRVLHTFIADQSGNLVADCYVANNDEEFILLCETIVDDASFDKLLADHGALEAGMEDLTASHAVIGVDGYKAWAVAKELFGPDVLGLPYLSIERYEHEATPLSLIRAGKTSEFGYLLLVPLAGAEKLFDAALSIAKKNNGALIGLDIHNDLRLEGRFFNIYAEGITVRDPLPLGIQWMIDFTKEKYSGHDAIAARRAAGCTQKIIGISADTSIALDKGAKLYNGDCIVGEVVASCVSYVLSCRVGLAMIAIDVAYAGLSFNVASANGPVVTTISMPPIMPKSLSVKLDEL